MRKVAFIVMICENANEKTNNEIKQIIQNARSLKTWRLEKTTILTEKQS